MSTPFYDLASLVVVPSGYKASKVYAQKPLTTDGQLTFSRASTATRVNSAGLIESVASNVPRLDYLGSTCPKLLLEPQRTNLVTYSEQIDNAAWGKTNATITANASPSPDGYQNADLFVPASGTTGRVEQITTTASANNTTYTGSVYFKKPTLAIDNITFYISDGTSALGSNRFGITMNLTNFTGTAFTFGNGVATSVSVVAVGNDWYRAIFTGSVTSGATGNWAFAARVLTTNATINGTNGLLIWGAQVEAGAYATSLINTTTAAVTRLADACNKTGVSSFFGSASGTFYMEFTYTAKNVEYGDYLFDITDSANTNRFLSFATGPAYSNKDTYVLYDTAVAGFATYDFYHNQRYKIAVVYDSTSTRWYINGVLVGTGGSFGYQMSQIYVFSRYSLNGITKGDIHQIMTFNTAQSNAKAIELTTL